MYIGKPQRRLEDARFLTGRGRYVDDMQVPGAACLAFLRSPHPHARIRSIDTGEAAAMPGILDVFTAAEWQQAGLGRLPIWLVVQSTDGVERRQVSWPVMAEGEVHYVGEIVAAVVAEDPDSAADAVEAIAVEYEPLAFVTDTAHAADPDAPPVHAEVGHAEAGHVEAGSNVFFLREVGDRAGTDAAFRRADHVVELKLRASRVSANPMEPRAVVAHYDPAEDHYTLHTSHQAPHMVRRSLADHILRHPEHKIRVVSPDVGGGFGMKVVDYPEDAIALHASKRAGRPVRWTATRSESLLGDAHGRDHFSRARMALDRDGRILALDVDTVANLGAYQTHRGASIPGYYYANFLLGLYRIPMLFCRVRGVHTHTQPVHAYRGAGRPEAAYVLERLLENAAREMGIDVMEIRRRNCIGADEFPYKAPFTMTYDSGDPPALIEQLRTLSRYEALREEQRRLREDGVLMGVGIAIGIDSMGVSSKTAAAIGTRTGNWDSASVRVHPSGKVSVFCGTHSHGQGHATTFAQLAADRLKCPIEDVEVVYGDTDRTPFGHGTWGSRSTVTSGMAVVAASDRIAEKCRKIAVHMLECDEGDIVHDEAGFRIVGTDRKLAFREIVDLAFRGVDLPEGMQPALEETAFYDPKDRNLAAAIHLAVVLVEPDAGEVRVRDYFAVDDCGTIINPMILEGQIQGGLAQGIGQALMEEVSIDHASGQLLAGSFMDYAMPRASDLPFFRLGSLETPTPHNVIGCKGGGESGTIAALPAMGNAVVDALWHLGVRHVEMPMRPAQVWQAVRAAAQ